MNLLSQETSPYLLQHAHNPVDWHAWNEKSLQKAQTEDKPILVSIGYSACHWCHVMERESFENEDIAKIMNEYFICIKIDREERPDVDAVYMDALQAMGIQGGWPLNVFLLPNQQPFYGGTYFRPNDFAGILQNIAAAFAKNRKELTESAQAFTKNIAASEISKYGLNPQKNEFLKENIIKMATQLAETFDDVYGGFDRSPKFPMPSIYVFLLKYLSLVPEIIGDIAPINEEKNKSRNNIKKHLFLTLEKIAKGGIYDQIGGGFSRYSVDEKWFAPHFEKMLYDNGQLLSLYSEAYQATNDNEQKDFFKQIVFQTINWLKIEMTSPENAFYAALDADSEGVEGKFYVFTEKEIKEILKDLSQEDIKLCLAFYNTKPHGNWEHNQNILHQNSGAENQNQNENKEIDKTTLKNKVSVWNERLLAYRNTRIRPGLDDKIIAGWNGLTIKGLVDSFRVFGENDFLVLAHKNADFLMKKLFVEGRLHRTYKSGKATQWACLEDYAPVIEGFLALFEATIGTHQALGFEYLQSAKTLTQYVMANFYDETEEMFFFTDRNAPKLIARKKEIFDNVIPASNSIMARNLYFLGKILDENTYIERAKNMVMRMDKILLKNVAYATNWASLYANMCVPLSEIVIIGEKCEQMRKELDKYHLPNKIILCSSVETDILPLFEFKTTEKNQTTIYVCKNNTCQRPVTSVAEALLLL